MWISDFAIRNRVVTTVVMLAFVVFGALALWMLDTDEYPDIQPPVVAVTVPYPGAAPRIVEREVVDVLEEGFTSITGVKRITSTALDSLAFIIVEYQFDKDLQAASQDIRDKLSELRADLPSEMEEPVLRRFDPQDLPIVSLTLSSPSRSTAQLTRLADPQLTAELRSISGVADVRLVGGLERELAVQLHPEAMNAANIGVTQVVQALGSQSLAVPVGRVTDRRSETTIRLRGRAEDPREFERLVVGSRAGRLIRLGDIADVRDTHVEPRSAAIFNGQPAVGVDIIKATGASTTAVSEQVRERLGALRSTLPADVELSVARDSGVRVEHSVQDVEFSLLLGAVLTVLTVFIFLNSWRSTVITGIALPVSVLAAFIAVWAFGFTLNTMSLLGLSLAIGILVDDAIVVRENIVRHIQMGKDHSRAAREGTAEIGLAVAATTFSIVVVFVPIAFMGGLAEQWFAPFALTIASSVMVSLLVSFSLDPMLSSIWADPALEAGKRGRVTRTIDRFNQWVERRTRDYQRVLAWSLRHRAAVLLIAIGTFLFALAVPALGWLGSEFFPVQDRSELVLDLEAPPTANLAYTQAKVAQAAQIAASIPEVEYTYATLGGPTQQAVGEASMFVKLKPKRERQRSQQQIEAELRERASRIAGVTASISSGGFGGQKQIQVQVVGDSLDQLNEVAEQVAAIARKVPGAVDVALSSKGQRPELVVEVDRGLASSIGVDVSQVAQALRIAFAGVDAGDWIDPDGETRDVRVRLAPDARERKADVQRLPLVVLTTAGRTVTVPLEQVANIGEGLAPAQITHLDREREITVGANTDGRPLNEVVAAIQRGIAGLKLPEGVEIRQGGETEDQREVFARIAVSLGVAVLLMYMVLVIQFESFLDPLPIMASLPLSLLGVVLALLATGSTLNLMSMIGVILLFGIVAKNAILLLDFAKWTEQRGVPRQQAILEAGGVRLRPILMTSVAIIAGMLPVAIGYGEGADFRAPLGRAVIGGVITSTLLTLIVIPTVYDMLSGLRERAARQLRRTKSEHIEAAATSRSDATPNASGTGRS